MKVAFHFDAGHPSLRDSSYNYAVQKHVIALVLEHRSASISSKILGGDLLLRQLACKSEEVESGRIHRFTPAKYERVCQAWMQPGHAIWSALLLDRVQVALTREICTVCFETLPDSVAERLHWRLLDSIPSYLGALEVDDASLIHWELYSNSIGPIYRLIGRRLTLFWDGITEDSKDEGLLQSIISDLNLAGKVEFESLNGRGTIFDEYHDFDHARRVAEWKRRFGSLLAFLAEDVVHRLGDGAPDLGDKLWSTLTTFEEAETNEQFAQVMASCRRIIEYVSDQLFPPLGEGENGRNLGVPHYRNRLLAFADAQRKSDINIELVAVSMESLREQLEKLSKLANKGVHAEVYRVEARRCLLRTVLLLDDIIGLKVGAFPVIAKLNFDGFLSAD